MKNYQTKFNLKSSTPKILIFLCSIMLFTSCWWDPNVENINQIVVKNNTDDTLVFSLILQHLCPTCENPAEDAWAIAPKGEALIGAEVRRSGFEIINDYCDDKLDTAVVYRIVYDTLIGKKLSIYSDRYHYVTPLVKWGGPLREMDKDVNSFYNENSWVFTLNPNDKKGKNTIATFTINDADLVQD